ncbi:putative ydr279p protein family (RNase H2 complex component) [Lyophyllum shimeji]|uniref:Ribonuclease H2 subunit B n=1 Tax=Lyophyllum shimeji TaxID=47721 RepID=A0A9P3PJZ2_LYOSH|nr:putative ydr279p protein family (RNase H2 complex component) [Lyophyllum shimeji]
MAIQFGVLPLDVLQTLSTTLEQGEKVSGGLSFIRLPHPRTGIPSLFLPYDTPSDASLPCAQRGILEVQAISPPDPRSWFLDEDVISDGKLLIMTPIDPAFLLIPILQAVHPCDGSAGTYRPADDIFEDAAAKLHATSGKPDDGPWILTKDIIRFGSLPCVKAALAHICDVKDITSEITVYRLSLPKALKYVRDKVTRLSCPDVLEISKSVTRNLAKDGLMEDGQETLLQAGRTRAACDLLGQYLSQDMRALLFESYDFSLLDAYFKAAKDEAAAAMIGTKNGKIKDRPAATDERKRKSAKGSKGVEALKKVNVNGMAKLSSFFKKA